MQGQLRTKSGGRRGTVLRTSLCLVVLVPAVGLTAASAIAATITSFAWYGSTTSGANRNTTLGATSATADSPPYCVGTNIVINGSGFVSDGGVTGVTIGGVAARYFSVGADDTLYAGVGANAQTGPIAVTTKLGTATSPMNVNILPCSLAAVARPIASTVTPAKAKSGKKVEVLGSGFIGTKSVTVGGVTTSFSIPSDYNLFLIMPKTAKNGPVAVVLTSAAGANTTLKIKLTKVA
jgi:hypothetical protein